MTMTGKRDSRDKPSFDVLKRIDDLRNEHGWSEYVLAQRSGIPQPVIFNWKRKNCTPTLVMIEKICTALGITLSQFFSEDGNTENEADANSVEMKAIWNLMDPQQREGLLIHLRTVIKK